MIYSLLALKFFVVYSVMSIIAKVCLIFEAVPSLQTINFILSLDTRDAYKRLYYTIKMGWLCNKIKTM